MKKRKSIVTFLTLFLYISLVFLLFTVPLRAEDKGFEIGLIRDHFNWKEFDDDGKLLLEESGLRKGINIAWNGEIMFIDCAIYKGTGKSDGVILLLNSTKKNLLPLEDVKYFGTKGEVGMILNKFMELSDDITIGNISLKTMPYLCLGLNYWTRLRNVKLLKNKEIKNLGSYEESREIWLLKIGVKNIAEMNFMQVRVNLWLGFDLLRSRNKINFSNFSFKNFLGLGLGQVLYRVIPSVIKVNADGYFFYGTDLTLKFNKFFINLYYKYYKWNKSSVEKICIGYIDHNYSTPKYRTINISVSQPESEERDYGIVVGLVF